MEHVVEMNKETLESVLKGNKIIETRFAQEKRPPYSCVHEDDTIYLKMKGGYTVAKANVSKVEEFQDLTPKEAEGLLNLYRDEIKPTTRMFDKDIYSRYATFIWMENVQEIRPFGIMNMGNHNPSWMMVEDINKVKTL